MTSPRAAHPAQPWERRLSLPAYRYAEAARLAQTTPQTISRWLRGAATPGRRMRPVLPARAPGLLSYLQLIEVAFVADFRRLGVPLDNLRRAHAYLRKAFAVEFPFAQLEVKTDGASVLVEYIEHEGGQALRRLVAADRGGQLAWPELIQARFEQLDYEGHRAVRWYPRGRSVPIVVDPRIAFGAPLVERAGVATWVLRERYEAGESLSDLEAEFGVTREQLAAALAFEGLALQAA